MDEKTLVWIRSGGRFAICNSYLLKTDYGGVVPVGENAHIVGQSDGKKSPRGDDPLPHEERDQAENLVLLCREQHKTIDRKRPRELFTIEYQNALATLYWRIHTEVRRYKDSHGEAADLFYALSQQFFAPT